MLVVVVALRATNKVEIAPWQGPNEKFEVDKKPPSGPKYKAQRNLEEIRYLTTFGRESCHARNGILVSPTTMMKFIIYVVQVRSRG